MCFHSVRISVPTENEYPEIVTYIAIYLLKRSSRASAMMHHEVLS